MTEDPGMTFDQMKEELDEALAHNTRLREISDTNFQNGREWKAQADALTKRNDELVRLAERATRNAESAIAEAAELRGYIKRVHETDGEGVKHFDVGFGPRPTNTMDDIERMMRR